MSDWKKDYNCGCCWILEDDSPERELLARISKGRTRKWVLRVFIPTESFGTLKAAKQAYYNKIQ